MLNLVNKTLTTLFGSKEKKDMDRMAPLVKQINQAYEQLKTLSDQQLRQQTASLIEEINTYLSEIDREINELKQQIVDNPDLGILQKENIYDQIDEWEKMRNKELEKVLLAILPRAFAVVKETAYRFTHKETLVVEANDLDIELAKKKTHIRIEGDTAHWASTWDVMGTPIKWNMVHYDVQLMGGITLHEGKIAEMATGEGKTLVATLPAYLNALAQRGVHIITVNDYLAKRDSTWMAPIFEFHGLTVDCIDRYQPHSEDRKKAYRSSITYGTNNEFGFDYLRDNMVHHPDDIVQPKLHFAMVDEVDSVLIDDARTPLIISGPIGKLQDQDYELLKPRISRIVDAQKELVRDLLNEAKNKLNANLEKEAGLPLFRAYRGLPKYKPLIKLLSEKGNKVLMQKTENFYLQDNQKMMPEADSVLYFSIDEKHNSVELTEKGLEFLASHSEEPNFFVLPDIAIELKKVDDSTLSDKDKLEKKNLITEEYKIKSQRIHTANQLLKAYCLFEKDVDYIVVQGRVMIVDEQTGRVMEGRRYSDGLHQALEAKENVKVEDATQTYATVTLQNYFRMYHKLAGMTGTAVTEAGEFWEIYKLDTVVIPTNVPATRKDQEDKVYKTMREKYNAVVEEIVELTEAGRPVLVGTTSVENSEILSKLLNIRKIKHQVLNAKFHEKEAEIVANAGQPSTVTIATNMAGRGTDIKLTPESKSAGGLAIIGTERHDSRRVDRQLRGRAGRQGDPGSSQFYVSLEDNLMRLFMTGPVAKMMDKLGIQEGEVIQHSMITKSIERAQKKVEENNFGIRKRLLEYDNVMNSQREFIYQKRKNALQGERLGLDLMNMIYETCEETVSSTQTDFDAFRLEVFSNFGFETKISMDRLVSGKANEVAADLYKEALTYYKEKNNRIIQTVMPFFNRLYVEKGQDVSTVVLPVTDGRMEIAIHANLKETIDSQGKHLIESIEKSITLAFIDQEWKEHLREMDDLKQSVQNAVHEQKDPLLIYKFEALELFKTLNKTLNEITLSFLFKAGLPADENAVRTARTPTRQERKPKVKETKQEVQNLSSAYSTTTPVPPELAVDEESRATKVEPAKSKKIANRNDKVNVRYLDGRILKNVKYKSIEMDLKNNRCELIED